MRRGPGVGELVRDDDDGGAPQRGGADGLVAGVRGRGGRAPRWVRPARGACGSPGQDRGQGQEPLPGRRKFMPDGSPAGPRSPTAASAASALVAAAPARTSGPGRSSTSRRTVRSNSWSRGCWKSRPTRSATLPVGMPAMSCPLIRTHPRSGPEQAVEVPQQRGLPGPVRARHSHDLVPPVRPGSGRPGCRDPFRRRPAGKPKADPLQLQNGSG